MSSSVPVVKQAAARAFFPQLLVLGLLVLLFYVLEFEDFYIYGIASYAILVFALRNGVARSHRKGIRLVKARRFEAAIPLFQKSIAFFTKNAWIDKYRFFTLLSSSQMSYREMGLCNIAFCYGQIGKGEEAKKYYEQVLAAFPNNGLAQAGLNMLTAGREEAPRRVKPE